MEVVIKEKEESKLINSNKTLDRIKSCHGPPIHGKYRDFFFTVRLHWHIHIHTLTQRRIHKMYIF